MLRMPTFRVQIDEATADGRRLFTIDPPIVFDIEADSEEGAREKAQAHVVAARSATRPATCPSCGAPLSKPVWQQQAADRPLAEFTLADYDAGRGPTVTVVTTCRRRTCIEAVPNRIPERDEPTD
jgi:hypothetical protein